MPRGGGGFSSGGGGFRGGFSGGGGFRGSSFGGRTGGFSSSRPFGRTGAMRTVNRGSSGPYSHSYHRPHSSYYRHGYYRPWYRTWYMSPFWGYHYRPWYRTPVFVTGGITIAIIFGLILLPLLGVAFAFPFSNADSNGNVNYRSTETLYFNEYWYEYEYIEANNDITFSVQSSSSVISFAISDEPFSGFPYTTKTGSISESNQNLQQNYYRYEGIFLKSGSTINYDFNSSAPVDFFITDGENLNDWSVGESYYQFYREYDDVTQRTGSYTVYSTEDVYLVWYNADASPVDVNYTIDYVATNVIDLSAAEYYEEAVTDIDSQSITVPTSDNWYFFIYFDPLNSPEESTTITFDVTYSTGVSSSERWIDAQPTLITIMVIAVILIMVGVMARNIQKKKKQKSTTGTSTVTKHTATYGGTPGPIKSSSSKSTYTSSYTSSKSSSTASSSSSITSTKHDCPSCGGEVGAGVLFCPYCGKIQEGRSFGTRKTSTPINSKYCHSCGEELSPNAKFCENCGARINR